MVSPLPKVDLVLSLILPLPLQFVILLKRYIEHSMCHVTVVFDPLRLLASFIFFKCPWLGSYPFKTCRGFAVND